MFSVIIPAYNREEEIKRSIDSVLNQTFQNFELIVVDNGSTDSTADVVDEYIKKDGRIKYYWQENSGSPAGSRNTGLKHAQYDWVAFLDSDDYWYPEKLQKVHDAINNNDDVILISHYEDKYIDDEFAEVLPHGKWLNENLFEELLFKGNCLSTSAVVAKTEKVKEAGCFDERRDYFAVEDYDLWLKLSLLGKFDFIKEPLGVFSISKSNMSGNINLVNDNLKTLIINKINELDIADTEKKSLIRIHGSRIDYYKGREFLLKGDFKTSRKILLASWLKYPWSLKKTASLIFSFLGIKK